MNEGEVKISRVDDAVRRILRLKARLNLWDVPTTNSEDYPNFGSSEFANVSYTAASESITLLKNENNTLPLPIGAKVLVVGPNSNSNRVLNGGWSYSWQGDAAFEYAKSFNTILKAIQDVNGAQNVQHVQGVTYIETGRYWAEKEDGIDQAVEAAKSVDYIILAIGENTYTEKMGDLVDLSISELQIKLALELVKTKKPIILVLSEGRPRIINKIVDEVAAVLWIYWPGNYGGDALADILFGHINPSGKLPVTYPRYRHSLINYWHKYAEEQVGQAGAYNYESDFNPLFQFGFGLSYTTFDYKNLTLSSSSIDKSTSLNVGVTVTNTGRIAGKEAVLLYTSDLYASIAPDVKRLRKFTKIFLQPGESKTISFELRSEDLSFINASSQRVTEPGEFEVKIANLKASFTYR